MGVPAAWRRAGALLALGLVLVLCATAGVAFAGKQERPANGVTAYVDDLREAAKLVEAASGSAAWVGSHGAKRCGQFEPAANKVAAAADAARAVFERYRQAKTRYGTQEEIRLITTIGVGLREARGNLRKAADQPDPVSRQEVDAALREVGLFQTFVAIKIGDRLGVEGLADVLQSRSFGEMRDKVAREIHAKLRRRAEAEIKRLTGLSIRLGVPLKEQIQDFLRAEFSRLVSRLVVTAGPAGILVSVIGDRIFSLVGKALQEALRGKGNLAGRTEATVTGFERLRRRLNALSPNAPLDKVRDAVRDTQQALGATTFLTGDLQRAKRTDLLADLQKAEGALRRTLSLSKRRFLLDSDLVGEDFGVAVSAMRAVRSEVESVAKSIGCQVAPPSGTGGAGPGGKGKAPTSAVCVPKSLRMDVLQSLPPYGKTGEYTAAFSKLTRVHPGDPLSTKCVWVTEPGGTTEAFVVIIEAIPPATPGRIASGDCGRNRPDSPPFYHSRKRYLSVSGGNRLAFQQATGGNEKVLEGVLAAAEAAGVGQACSK